MTWVQTAKPSTAAAATGAIRRPVWTARSRSSPSVLSARKLAPCSRHSSTTVTPVNNEYGLSRSVNVPAYSWSVPIGTPCSRLPRATPMSRGASRLPPVVAASQARRQPALSRLPRNSNDTPRAISATSSSRKAR